MSITGVTYTADDSYVSVTWSPSIERYILDCPFDKKMWRTIKNIEGSEWDEIVKNKFTFPKHSIATATQLLGTSIKWKSKEEVHRAVEILKRKEETLQNVLTRIPSTIDTSYLKLEPYNFQKLAVAWAATPKGLHTPIRGGLLADLMGLGKTLEALAIAGYFKQQGWIKNCLIVCPATLKTQWGQEIEKFTHEDYTIIKSGKGNKAVQGRLDLYEEVRRTQPFYTIVNYELLIQKERLGKEVVSTSKEGKEKTRYIFGDYIDLNQIKDIGYDMIVVDEAQNMKNPSAERSKAIRQIQPTHRLLMTGTPISKDLKNIFQLMDYIHEDILTTSDANFDERYQLFEDMFLVTGFNSFALPARIKEIKAEKNIGILRKKINPFILRRTTEDVSDEMPEKQEIMVTVEWEEKQKKLYDKVLDEIEKTGNAMTNAKDEEQREKWNVHLKLLNQMLLAVCDSPELLAMSSSPVAKRLIGKQTSYPRTQKIERLLEMVEEIVFENDGKLVIFTKFERMTHILAREINALFQKKGKQEKEEPYKTFLYTGKVSSSSCQWRDTLQAENKEYQHAVCKNGCPFYDACDTRTKAAWHFQNDPDTRIILATDAGNSGVNLQSGGYLINYDLPDSFDIYDQRNARIRRLGSAHSTVYIYNLVTKGGVDEAKFRKLMKQKAVIDKVVENDNTQNHAIDQATQSLQ